MQSYTPTQFSKMTGITRETIMKRVDGVQPAEVVREESKKPWNKYTIKQYIEAFVEWERQKNSPGQISKDGELARKYKEEADKLERERLREEGETLLATDVKRVWENTLSRIKARLMACPPRIGTKTAKISDPNECESIANEHISEALEELANESD